MKNFNFLSNVRAFARLAGTSALLLVFLMSFMTNTNAQQSVTIKTDATWECFPLPKPASNPPYPTTNTFSDPPAGWRTTCGSWTSPLTVNGNDIWAKVPTPSTINNYIWAAGFRKCFQLTPANIAGYHTLSILVNNGADIWINGNFLANSNWVSGTQTFCIPSSWLVVGTNYIAVKAFEYLDFASSLNITATFGQASNASIAANNPCVGSAINLTTTITGSTSGLTFKWTGPNGFTSTLQNPVIATATAAMSGVYTLEIKNAAGCTQTLTTNVVVNPLPVVTISGQTVICAGTSTVLTAAGGGTYKWSTTATTPAITVSAAGTYSVTVTSPNGCTATKSVTVVVNPLPVVTISGNLVICAGTNTLLTATGGGTYKWSTGAVTPAITVSAGTYSVTVTSPNGCTATKSVTVSLLPSPVISLVSQTVICKGNISVVSIDINVTGGTAPYTYVWSNNATTQDLVNVVGNVTSYCVTVTDAKGCKTKRCFDCISPCNLNVTDIISDQAMVGQTNNTAEVIKQTHNEDLGEKDEMITTLYQNKPNPSNNATVISYSLAKELPSATLVVMDILGREVKREALTERKGDIKLDVSTLPNGTYLYLLSAQGRIVTTKKMVINHATN
jgi:hypothetical protein